MANPDHNPARIALLVEDDPDVRSLAAFLFADIRLRRMDGVELARIVKRDWPWIRVLVTSGNPGDRLGDLPRGAKYMQKPWRALDVLIEAERAAAA